MKVKGVEVVLLEGSHGAREAVNLLSGDMVIAIDSETTGLSPWRDNLALIQLYGDTSGIAILFRVTNGVVPVELYDLFIPDRLFIGHNVVGFDLLFFHNHGIPWARSKWYDTLVGESVVTSTGRRNVSKSLRNSVKRRLGFEIDKTIEHGNWVRTDLSDRQIEYAVEDVLSLPALRRVQLEKADETNQTEAVNMEMELGPYVVQMILNGLPMYPHVVREWILEQRELMRASHELLVRELGPINLNSPIQLKKALHLKGIDLASTGVDVLTDFLQLGNDSLGIVQAVMDYRKPAQRIKMYNDAWTERFIESNRVHARFWQVGADTGRFSSSDPNLQQIPKNGRRIIGGLDGWKIVSCDYSQIEVRIAAALAEDEELIRRLQDDDVHASIASAIFEVPQGEVTKEQRKQSKALTFTLLFGGGAQLLYDYSRRSGGSITYENAVLFVEKFFETFPGLARMKRKAQNMAQRSYPVVLRLPNSMRRVLVGYEKTFTRILNTSVQGSAAVGMKYALIEMGKRGLMKYVGSVVHDEIVACVPNDEVDEYIVGMEAAMIDGMSKIISTTIKVETKVGEYWS